MSAAAPALDKSAPRHTLAADFDRWAASYDRAPNPLLSLEERHLGKMLHEIEGRDVLDAGCGTGRWLHHCSRRHPASLTGVDISSAMLERAREKLGASAKLCCAAVDDLPVADASTDLVIGSFMLSYVESVQAFAEECERITRPGAVVVLSDMHPTTAVARGWKRSFRDGQESVELDVHPHSLPLILAAFGRCAFELVELLEPAFGEPERELFATSGRLSEFDSVAALPAIYILKLARITPARRAFVRKSRTLSLTGSRYAVGPHESRVTTISMQDGRVSSLTEGVAPSENAFDLSGYLVLPGLVNAHDHLEFALFPNLGRSAEDAPYGNATEWASEIHRIHADAIALHRSVPRDTCLWWGAVRNLLCGVTSVCHHNEIYPLLRDREFPLRVITRFGWAHSLALEPAIEERSRATPAGRPFILHAGEGTDRTSAVEIFDLDRMGLLSDLTVLVHGLSLTEEGVALMNSRGSSLVVCPTSNRFLFHQVSEASVVSSLRNIALGSDSPLTAAGDLLDEIHCLHREIGVPQNRIYEMVTRQPAEMLRLDRGEGCIRQDSIADMIAVPDTRGAPAEVLANLDFEQVELSLVGGRVQLASDAIYARLPAGLREGLQPLEVNGVRRWLRAPIAEMMRVTCRVLGDDVVLLGGKQVSLDPSV